ncbi:MAG: hypothetical protein PUE18_10590, partial [Firmicutes bacterium]|nr:hypothetical protein [Bacillota bacterium]
MYYYVLFEYVVESDMEFPQLVKTEERLADIRIKKGDIPDEIYSKEQNIGYRFGEKSSWLVNRVCYLYVENGDCIIYKAKEGVSVNRLRNCIMGLGMSMLGLQRGIIAMHCSVVASDSGAILISGESGTGKSTLTNTLLENGCKFMADDMAYVETKDR